MNPYFEKLGRTIAARWQDQNFSLEAFPELTQITLDESPPSENLDLDQVIHEFLTNDDQPFQSQSGFGQPELVAFNHPRFYIQILFWLEGTTQIHQHEFSGAFHVMNGSSLHSEFDFTAARSITPHIRTGDLQLKRVELLETGRTIPITSGRDCIHSLFHLDTPSVTVVVRTQHDPGTGPQFNYLPPHIAVDPLHADALTMRRKQLLEVLETLDNPDYSIRVNEMVGKLDFERGFHILRHAMDRLQQSGDWDSILTTFQTKHGDLAKGVCATLAECHRRETISGMRYHIENPDHRFFLALLLNIPTRADILTFIAARAPHQPPLTTLLGWVEELIEPSECGAFLLDATFPETFDLPLEEQPGAIVTALEQALQENAKNTEATYLVLKTSCLSPLFS